MEVFEDPYKSEGIIQLKIEKLSQFAQDKPLTTLLRSDAIYVRGLLWNIVAKKLGSKYNEPHHKHLGYFLECSTKDAGPAWSCNCSVALKVLAQKDGIEDYDVHRFSKIFHADYSSRGLHQFLSFEELMNPELGWYDEVTDSIILQVEIAANAPHGVKNMPNDVYTEYTMRSEHALFVELKDGMDTYNTANLAIEDKLWSFTYSSSDKMLNLKMSTHQLDSSKTTAECIFWYWKNEEIAILQKMVHTFGEAMVNDPHSSGMKCSRISVPTNDSSPVNNKFTVVVRLLDEQIASANNSMESYFGDYEGVETVTLNVLGIKKEASFVVPKLDVIRASPVFQRMFANKMTERATSKVEIKDTNPEEFGDFLRAISPKQQLPNPSNVFALLKLADRYNCQSLCDRCERHLMNCMEIPLIHRLTCANFYGLNKLKNNLMVSLDGTDLFKLLQQTEPYFGILVEELTRKNKEKEAHMNG